MPTIAGQTAGQVTGSGQLAMKRGNALMRAPLHTWQYLDRTVLVAFENADAA